MSCNSYHDLFADLRNGYLVKLASPLTTAAAAAGQWDALAFFKMAALTMRIRLPNFGVLQ